MTSLQTLPTELLLAISKWMEPEDSLSFIQTCKSLVILTEYKVFWIECAQNLQRRRKVHHRPVHLLDTAELRSSVFHALKLDLKWSGAEGIDPSPVRRIDLDTTQLHIEPLESGAVTWAWFLEDGVHILCIVDDILVQLWHIPSQRLIMAFRTKGQLIRASKYMDEHYFVLSASVSDGSERWFQIWKYEWGSKAIQLSSPVFDIPISDDSTFTFVTHDMAGLAYVDNAGSPMAGSNSSDNVNFVVVNWRSPVPPNPIFCFTPLGSFGENYAQECRRDHFRMTRTTSQILMHFESTLCIVAFSFSLSMFATLLQRKTDYGVGERIRINPNLKVRYELNPSEHSGLPDDEWATWGDSSLWDGQRVGLMSKTDKTTEDLNENIICLSVLDLPPEDLLGAEDDFHIGMKHHVAPEVRTTFTRPMIYIKPSDQEFALTPDRHILVSQPKASKSVVWALAPPYSLELEAESEELRQMHSLVFAHFPPFDVANDKRDDGDWNMFKKMNPEKYGDRNLPSLEQEYDFEAPLQARGKVITVDVSKWLPVDDKAMDLDLDDVYGRVALGMESGTVIILQFV